MHFIGLNLGRLKTEWLEPSLMDGDSFTSHISTTKWLNLIRRSRQRSFDATVPGGKDENTPLDVGPADRSSHDDMTSEGGSLGSSIIHGSSCESILTNIDENRSSPSITSVHKTLSQSVSDFRLLTVEECNGFPLPDNRLNHDKAFLERSVMSSSAGQRRFSDISETLFEDQVSQKSNVSFVAGQKTNQSMFRSKSGSIIFGKMKGASSTPIRKNPVR